MLDTRNDMNIITNRTEFTAHEKDLLVSNLRSTGALMKDEELPPLTKLNILQQTTPDGESTQITFAARTGNVGEYILHGYCLGDMMYAELMDMDEDLTSVFLKTL